MEAVVNHVQNNVAAYGLGVAFLLFLFVVFRRYAVGVLLYAVEIAIYMSILHCVVWVVVHVAAWFRKETAMEAVGTERVTPPWTIPLLEFWKLDEYNPSWLFYMELVLFVLLTALVWRYRPMYGNKRKRARRKTAKSKSGSAVRSFESAGRGGVRKR